MQPGAQINSPAGKGGDQGATAKNPLANLLSQIQGSSSPDNGQV